MGKYKDKLIEQEEDDLLAGIVKDEQEEDATYSREETATYDRDEWFREYYKDIQYDSLGG